MPEQTTQNQMPIRYFYQGGSPEFQQLTVGASPNVPSGFQEIDLARAQELSRSNPNMPVAGLGIKFTRDQLLSSQIPQSGVLAQGSQPGTSFVPVAQEQEYQANQQAVAAGTMQNWGTAQAPLYVPTGTPTPQQSNAAFQAMQPVATYQEVQNPNYDFNQFEEGFNQAQSQGYTAPTDATGASNMFSQFLNQNSAVADFVSQDPYLNSVMSNYQNYMSSVNQRTSLVDTYKQMLADSGIQQMDTDLINMKNVIEGTEDDIRTEVTKAGGFATESQVIALSNARNKQLIKNYNTLLETRNSKASYLDTMMNLTQQDRAEADAQFDTMMNYGMQIAQINQQMKQNAVATLDRVAQTIGWDGVYQATGGNQQMIAQIERTYGLPAGTLRIAAQRDFATRNKENIQLSQENAIIGLIQQGITDPLQIYDYMNYYEGGQPIAGTPVSIETINDVLNKIKSGGEKPTADIQEYEYAKNQGYTGTFQQWQNQKSSSSDTKLPTVKSGGLIISESNIADWQNQLENSRGAPYINEKQQSVQPTGKDAEYVNSALYLQMLQEWTDSGGLSQDFFTQFPPKNYLNPNDASIPQWIRDKLKSVSSSSSSSVIKNPFE